MGARSGNLKAGFKGFGAGVSGNSSTTSETSQVIRETPAWRFSHLYNLLEQDQQVQFLSQFNQSKYDQLVIGKIVELRARMQLTEWDHLIEELESLEKFANLVQ